jgi:hypothetical protein
MDWLSRCSLAIQFFVLAYLCGVLLPIPLPKYFPTLHTWGFEAIQGQPAMKWYGFVAFGLAVGALGYALGGLYGRLQARSKFDFVTPSACIAVLIFVTGVVWSEAHHWF